MRNLPVRSALALVMVLAAALLAVLLILRAPWGASRSVALDHAFRFNAQGQLPVDNQVTLPVTPGSVRIRWYTLNGWYAAVFEGLDETVAATVCLGTSIQNGATGRYEYIANSTVDAMNPAPCANDHGAGTTVLGTHDLGQYGGRRCHGRVGYVTRIPSDLDGTLLMWVATFPGDGTGAGVSGQFDTSSGSVREIDLALVNCKPLPDKRQPVVVAPDVTPAPPSAGAVSASKRKPPPAPKDTGRCFTAEPGHLQNIDSTDAAPYLLHLPPHPEGAPVVIFLPGGSGTASGAQSVWTRFFANRAETDRFVVVIPYVKDGDLITDTGRMLVILNEVLWCARANAREVHLAGTSNGGLAAFSVMSAHPEYFATLLGAPGAFPVPDPSKVKRDVWASRLAGRAVFNGVGALDFGWNAEVMATHNALAAAKVESRFVEFSGQGHTTNANFDPSVFFDFWSRH